jgi:hypothetical protein
MKYVWKSKIKYILIAVLLVLANFALNISHAMPVKAGSQAWSFGVIADTQWENSDDGYNPNTVAANVIKQIDQQFIKAGVKLVIQPGDTVDTSSTVTIDTRALYAQDRGWSYLRHFPGN